MSRKKIDASKATPQAARSLRVGSKGFGRALRAKAEGKEPPPEEPDDDDEDDDDDHEDAIAEHEPLRADAEAAHVKAAEAWGACKATDGAGAHQAAMEAEDAASAAGAKAKAGSMKLLGMEPEEHEGAAPPAAPPPGAAQALSALAGSSARAQMDLAKLAGWATETMGKLGAKTLAGASAKLEQALTALAKLPKIEATAKVTATDARLAAAVHAGMPLAKAFVDGERAKGPLPTWARMDAAALDEVLTINGYPVGAPPDPRSTMIVASADGGGEAGLAARAAANGVDVDTQRLAEKNRSMDR